jgi:hypothetical protein
MTKEDLENRFTYHAPSPEQIPVYQELRDRGKSAAALMNEVCPESRELSLAHTKLEEAIMWANAAIARHGLRGVAVLLMMLAFAALPAHAAYFEIDLGITRNEFDSSLVNPTLGKADRWQTPLLLPANDAREYGFEGKLSWLFDLRDYAPLKAVWVKYEDTGLTKQAAAGVTLRFGKGY